MAHDPPCNCGNCGRSLGGRQASSAAGGLGRKILPKGARRVNRGGGQRSDGARSPGSRRSPNIYGFGEYLSESTSGFALHSAISLVPRGTARASRGTAEGFAEG